MNLKTINEYSKQEKYEQKQAKKKRKEKKKVKKNSEQKQRDTEKRRIKSRPKTNVAYYCIIFEYLKLLL